ncbi:energy transducer TonB [Sphingomonas mucosissima]|uniref:Transport protein TonB n=1 Tax=Sphingomonas mucosissima TaxID=370959 RepID=A0A245ZQ70_9SPHN|nr:energy transducer TonB [Sphingomonas mucosissima]OWK31881.1 transport protein TonB [Sphingomonas mucosissima]
MYANLYARPAGVNVGSLAVAVAINAGVIGALMFSAPVIEAIKQRTSLRIENIPLDPPPPEPMPPQPPRVTKDSLAVPRERPMTSTSLTPDTSGEYVIPSLRLPPLPPLPPLPTGEMTRADPPAPPVIVDARVDPRYARQLQPEYPAGERRAEREGNVTVRVTIGRDGRVVGAECVTATSEDFCRATRQHAMAKWRFQPATRDGVATETVKEMTVRFQLMS